MRIGVISNSDACLPLIYTLVSQKEIDLHVYFSPGQDTFQNEQLRMLFKNMALKLTEENDALCDIYQWYRSLQPSLCFMLGYAKRLDVKQLPGCENTFYNIHFGPLPAYRGPIPLFWQLKKGEAMLGLCIHQVNEKLDSGKVVWEKSIKNELWYNYGILVKIMSQLCLEGVIAIIKMRMAAINLPVVSSENKHASYHKRPDLKDITIQWDAMNAAEISNLVRACNPWNKGAVTQMANRYIKILDAYQTNQITRPDQYASPGTITQIDHDHFLVQCINQEQIAVTMIYIDEIFVPARTIQQYGIKSGMKFL